jgi:hypothetical protein
MRWNSKFALVALAGMTCSMVGPQLALSQTLPTHRIPAALALEAVGEAVAACARQGLGPKRRSSMCPTRRIPPQARRA